MMLPPPVSNFLPPSSLPEALGGSSLPPDPASYSAQANAQAGMAAVPNASYVPPLDEEIDLDDL